MDAFSPGGLFTKSYDFTFDKLGLSLALSTMAADFWWDIRMASCSLSVTTTPSILSSLSFVCFTRRSSWETDFCSPVYGASESESAVSLRGTRLCLSPLVSTASDTGLSL